MPARQIWRNRLDYGLAGLLLLVLATELGFFARFRHGCDPPHRLFVIAGPQEEAHTAVEMAPQRMQAHLTLAQILIRAEQFAQARVEYSEAIHLAEMGDERYYRIPLYAARKVLRN
jgi:hypothetical protein